MAPAPAAAEIKIQPHTLHLPSHTHNSWRLRRPQQKSKFSHIPSTYLHIPTIHGACAGRSRNQNSATYPPPTFTYPQFMAHAPAAAEIKIQPHTLHLPSHTHNSWRMRRP